MDWAIWVLIAVMLGLYVWSHLTAGHEIDDLFGDTPSERESKSRPTAKPKAK
jgi:hypothetical protein